MTAYTFAAAPSRSIEVLGCEQTICLDQAIRDRLPEGERITRDVAISILRNISWGSRVAAFFSQPFVAIPLIAIASYAVLAATVVALAALTGGTLPGLLKFVSVILGVIAGLFSTWSISCFDEWNELSEAYSAQSLRAQEYIELLQDEDADMEIRFPLPQVRYSRVYEDSDSDIESTGW